MRGWLTNKVYADGLGPKYTYTGAGRLKTRLWARGVTTTYGYTGAGDLASVDYSDSTPDAACTHDRRGRAMQVTGAATVSSLYNDAGQIVSETHSGLTLTNLFDSRLRRTSLAVYNGATLLTAVTNAYDNASRLASVTFGTNSATYGYLTNSAFVETLTFKNGATTRMTTSNRYDNLNRLTLKDDRTGSTPIATFSYAYNTANQRTAMTNTDVSRWSFGYDSLGQVTSGKRYWSDGNVVAGQQFEYSFDDIGNRKTAASGGDQWGANLRYQTYSANNLNQYTQRTAPGFADIQGSATNTATVTVNNQPTYRKNDYFRTELATDNSTAPVWQGVTNIAVIPQGTNVDIVTNITGNVLLPKYVETFFHDLDGNQLSDSVWTNTWNAENRLVATETGPGVPSAGKAKQTWTHLADGRWIERVVSTWNGSAYVAQMTNRFVWDGLVLLAIVDQTNGLVMSFPRGLDLSGSIQGAGGVGGVLAVGIAANGSHFVAYDGNGNLGALTDVTNGSATAQYEYSPFGETLRATGPTAKVNPIRFSTQWADEVTGNVKYLFRDYVAGNGRWPNSDPLGEFAGNNRYTFVLNAPVGFIDVLGLQTRVAPPPVQRGPYLNSPGNLGGTAGSGTATGPGVFGLGTSGTLALGVGEVGVGTIVAGGTVAAVIGGGIGYGVSHIPVYGGGNIAEFYGNAIYDAFWPKPEPVNSARRETGHQNEIGDQALLEAKRTGRDICDILAEMMRDEKCKGRNADSELIRKIKESQKRFGCRKRGAEY